VETVRPDYGTTIPIFFRTANDDAPATTPSPLVVQLQCRLLVKKREIAAFENDLDIHIESSGSARFCGFYEFYEIRSTGLRMRRAFPTS